MSLQGLIEHSVSQKFSDHALISSDRSILSRRQVEIIPREASTFGSQTVTDVAYNGTLSNKMTFNLSDPRHYCDWKNTYFHMELKVGASSSGGADIKAFLDNGGVHSLIKSVVIRHGSAEFVRLENYNKYYNIMNLAKNSADYRDMMLADCADSFDDQYVRIEDDYERTNNIDEKFSS